MSTEVKAIEVIYDGCETVSGVGSIDIDNYSVLFGVETDACNSAVPLAALAFFDF